MKNIKIRSVKDKTAKKTWFSAIDLVRLINGTTHKRAKNYWGYIKNKLALNTSQLAMLCPDGKYRYTDVVDIDQIAFILRACNKRFFMFFFEMHTKKIYKYLKELGKEYADSFVLVCKDHPHLLRRKITVIKDIDIHTKSSMNRLSA